MDGRNLAEFLIRIVMNNIRPRFDPINVLSCIQQILMTFYLCLLHSVLVLGSQLTSLCVAQCACTGVTSDISLYPFEKKVFYV